MKTTQINLYEFDELSEDAKSKALNNHNENNDYYFLEENLNEYLRQLLEDNGIKGDAKLYYNLSYSQGDGVNFEGNFEYKNIYFDISQEGRCIEAQFDEDDELKNDLIEVIEQDFKEIYATICDSVKKIGYSEIEYEQSEENFKELCECNEYTFEIDGTMRNF